MNIHPVKAILPLLLFNAWIAFAQDGLVRASGQPIPGATITATQGTQKLTTVTSEDGRYHFDNLSPGDWQVTVDMFGFAQDKRQISIGLAALPIEWELKLDNRPRPQVARARPAAGGPQGRNAAAGFQNLTLQNQQNEAEAAPQAAPESPGLPAGNANESFLVNGSLSQGLAQGAAQGRQEDALNQIPGGIGGSLGGGLGGNFAQQSLDGGPPQAAGGGRGGAAGGGFGGAPGGGGFGGAGGRGGGGPGGRGGPRRPGADGVRQFGNRRRQQGIHGSAFLAVGNSIVNARPYSLSGQELVQQPSYGSARYGISGGGPLVIPHLLNSSKTFFFLNYTGVSSRVPYTNYSTVPTGLQRTGNFSQTQTAAGLPVQIFDPTTNAPFPGAIVPGSRIDPSALGLLSLFPLPNQPGSIQNYVISRSIASNAQNINARVNRPITPKDQVDANINYQNRNSQNAQLFGYRDLVDGYGLSISAGWTRTLGKATTNVLRFTFSRNRAETMSAFSNGPNYAAMFGINGTSQNPVNFGPPNLSFTNYGSLSDANPSLTRNQTAGLSDGLIFVRGRHTITTGAELRRQDLALKTDTNARGSFSFSGLLTSQFNAAGQATPSTGYDFADYLLGFPQSSSIGFGDTSNYFRALAFSAYVGDDFRVKSGLTVNVSLRYEYFTPYSEKYGHIANLDIAPGFTAVSVVTPGAVGPYSGKFPDALVNGDPLVFSPRIGIAWKPWKQRQALIRAGYSIFYNGSIYSTFPFRLSSQPPFAVSANLVTDTTNPLTIRNGFAATPIQSITNTFAVDKGYRLGYIQTWNFAIQQTLPHQFVTELGYLGTKGTRLDIQEYPNRALPGTSNSSQSNLQIANATGFVYDTWNGNSIYHAGQARITRRFSRGISANLLYTFSKSIDNASSIGGGGTVYAQNALDLSAERGLSAFDRRHVLNGNFVLTSPFGEQGLMKGRGWSEKLLQDWTLNGNITASSGLPLTARVLGNQANIAGTGAVGSGRANATGASINSGGGPFNLAAFSLPNSGQYGNAGRDTIPGPGLFTINLSFGRSFKIIDERKRIEFRVDSLNPLNRVNISGYYTTINATNYGLASAVGAMRSLTATVRYRF